MQSMAKQMNLPKLNQIMMEFVKENEKMETQQELIGDSIDDVMEGDADEEEEDKIVGQVLDEIGIDLTSAVPEAPSKQAAQPQAVTALPAPAAVGTSTSSSGGGGPSAAGDSGSDATVNELEARLNNLRRY